MRKYPRPVEKTNLASISRGHPHLSPPIRLQTPLPTCRIDVLDSGRHFGRVERLKGLAVSGTAVGTGTGG
jgi:hypothetical protein